MVYSMTEWHRMKGVVAEEDRLEVLVWRSPEVPEAEWRAAAERAGWTTGQIEGVLPVPAACREWVGQPNHFPFSVLVTADGRQSAPIWGVLPDESWRESLRFRQRKLRMMGADGP